MQKQAQTQTTPAQKAPLTQEALKQVNGGVSEAQCTKAGGTWDPKDKVCTM